MTPSELKELKVPLQELAYKGFIQPSSLLWGAPIFLIKKRDRMLRMCIDNWELNMLNIKDNYLLPKIDGV